MLVRRRLVPVPILCLCAVLAVLATLASPDGARAALTWSTTKTPVETTAGLTAIACPGTGLCVAGGAGDRLAVSTDPSAGTWSAFTVATGSPGTIADVSCASATMCVAVDSAGNVLSSANAAGGAAAWHAEHFTRPAPATGPMELTSVSCPTETRCAAVDRSDNSVLSTTSPSSSQAGWNRDQLPNTPGQVSCTAVLCVAVSGAHVFTTSAVGTGGSAWAQTTLEGDEGSSGNGRPISISCTQLLCVAGGEGGINGTEVFSSTNPAGGAAAWKHTPIDGSELDDANCVSTVATTLCTLSTDFGAFVLDSLEPTGATAAWASSANVGGPLSAPEDVTDVACPTTSQCVAVTEGGYAVVAGGSVSQPAEPSEPSHPSDGSGGGTSGGSTNSNGAALLPDAPGPFTGAHFPTGTTTLSHTSNAVSFLLESSVDVTGTLSGSTVGSSSTFALTAGRARAGARPLSLGKVKFTLAPNKPKRVTLALPARVRTLLKGRGTLPVLFTIASKDTLGHESTVSKRYTLKAPPRAAKHRR